MSSRKHRTAHRRVVSWEKRGLAIISDKVPELLFFRVATKERNNVVDTVVVPTGHQTPDVTGREGRFSNDWMVSGNEAQNPVVQRIGDRVVHIASFPTWQQVADGREQRTYNDVLFLGGELEITLPQDQPEIFRMGTVVGLSVITEAETFQVWTPHD